MPTREIEDLSTYEVKPKTTDFVLMPLTQGHVLIHTRSCHLKNPLSSNVEAMLPVSREFVVGLFDREKEARKYGVMRHLTGFCGHCVLRKERV